MKVTCENCGKEINKKPSVIKKHVYCNKICRREAKHMVGNCPACGKTVVKLKCIGSKNPCCNMKCFRKYASMRMTEMNIELNPDRMTLETRTKLREARLDTGEGKTYTKTFSRHTHRIVAEQMLGRSLKSGEVVHHIDGDRRNNKPSNLEVFVSQAEHAAHHMGLKKFARL